MVILTFHLVLSSYEYFCHDLSKKRDCRQWNEGNLRREGGNEKNDRARIGNTTEYLQPNLRFVKLAMIIHFCVYIEPTEIQMVAEMGEGAEGRGEWSVQVGPSDA